MNTGEQPLSLVYTERVSGSNPLPPTRSSGCRTSVAPASPLSEESGERALIRNLVQALLIGIELVVVFEECHDIDEVLDGHRVVE